MNNRIRKNTLSLLTLLILVISLTSNVIAKPINPNIAQNEVESAIINGLDYISSQMNDDGGIRWMDESSDVTTSIKVVLALAAAGLPQNYLTSDSLNRPIDFLADVGADWVYQSTMEDPTISVEKAGQLLSAVAAADENPHGFGQESIDLVSIINANYNPNTGVFGYASNDNVMPQVWAILGLRATNASLPRESVNWLANVQLEDGSWNDGFGFFLDTTPLALMALIASDEYTMKSPIVQTAIKFLQDNQQPGGGWQTDWDTTTNANTTGMILQAIFALGQHPSDDEWRVVNESATTALLELQQENGVIGGDFANTYSTADAILGLSGQPFYDLGIFRRVSRAFNFLFNTQETNGGWGSVGQTIDVMLAIDAAGWDPNTVTQNNNTPLQFITENLVAYLENGPDAIGKTILGILIVGEDPTDFSGLNLVNKLMETYNPEVSAFGTPENTWHQALAILSLSAADADIPKGAVQTLISMQQANGSWEYMPGFGFYIDSTSLSIQALLATGMSPEDEKLQEAINFILSQQSPEGDWGDSSTTAYAIMALNALGIHPDDLQTDVGKTPIASLFNYQKYSGAFMYSNEFSEDNIMATSTALFATLSGDYLIERPIILEENFSGLLIHPGEGEFFTACVSFNTETISGLELMTDSGFTYSIQDGFVNSIMDVENPPGSTLYWSYWQWDGREWIFNNVGASESQVLPGSIEAWHFTSWEVFPSLPPNYIPNLNDICNMSIPKNYASQPFLNYQDLHRQPAVVAEVTQPILAETALEPTEETNETKIPTATAISEEQNSENRSAFPFIILGIVGAVVAILTLIILPKKAQ